MKLTPPQLATLCDIALEAGRAIMQVYQGEFAAIEKDDASPLTEADLRSDAIIEAGLRAAFPGIAIRSEESLHPVADACDCFFLVDPLDGTKEFIKRNGEFTVNIALVACGYPVAGVVLAPAFNELYFAAPGIGAWKRCAAGETALAVARWDGARSLGIVGSRSHGNAAMDQWLSRLRCQHHFLAAGSSLKFCRLAEGAADLYPRFVPCMQWDTAAGQCILELAGGAVHDLDGQRLRYGLERDLRNPYFIAKGELLHEID
jgi:3'(2'), 5'-bisphosphate nucleotidase